MCAGELQVTNAGIDWTVDGVKHSNVVLAVRTTTDPSGTYGLRRPMAIAGGPVVASPDGTDSQFNMQARGIISASNGDWVVCDPNLLAPDGRGGVGCVTGVAYVGMSAIVNTVGLSLYTS